MSALHSRNKPQLVMVYFFSDIANCNLLIFLLLYFQRSQGILACDIFLYYFCPILVSGYINQGLINTVRNVPFSYILKEIVQKSYDFFLTCLDDPLKQSVPRFFFSESCYFFLLFFFTMNLISFLVIALFRLSIGLLFIPSVAFVLLSFTAYLFIS